MLADGIVIQSIPVLYPFIRDDLGLTRAQVGLITSAIMGTSMITVVIGGWLSDTWGAKKILVIVMLYIAIAVLTLSLINSFWTALLAGLLIGIGVGPFYPLTSKQIIDWLPQKTRALGMSIKQTGPPVAGAVAAVTLPSIAIATNWRITTLIMSVVILALTLVIFFCYKDKSQVTKKETKISLHSFLDIGKNRTLMILTLWAFCMVGLQQTVVSYLILYLVEDLEYSTVLAGGYLSICLIASVIGRIFWGGASDLLFRGSRKVTLAGIGLLGMIGLLALSFMEPTSSKILVILAVSIIGASAMSWPGIFTVYVAEISGAERSGTAIGSTNAIVRIGIIIMPPLFGHLVDTTNSYYTGWLVTSIIAIASTLIMLAWAKDPNQGDNLVSR
jgi:predicted MFS family arabinose efflux permease